MCSVCAIATRRTALIPHLISTQDRPWDVVRDYIFSYLEVNTGIICASVPALKPFFLRFWPSIVTSHMTRRGRATSGSKYAPRSYGMGTVTEQNRQRRRLQLGSYVLSSRDDGRRSNDEEAKLWSRKDGDMRSANRTNATDSVNLEMLEDISAAKGFNQTTVAVQPPRAVQGGIIQVEHETVIDYGR